MGLISPFHLFNFPFLGNLKSVKRNIAFLLLGASFRFGVTEESGLSMLCRIYGKFTITVIKFEVTDTYALAQNGYVELSNPIKQNVYYPILRNISFTQQKSCGDKILQMKVDHREVYSDF